MGRSPDFETIEEHMKRRHESLMAKITDGFTAYASGDWLRRMVKRGEKTEWNPTNSTEQTNSIYTLTPKTTHSHTHTHTPTHKNKIPFRLHGIPEPNSYWTKKNSKQTKKSPNLQE